MAKLFLPLGPLDRTKTLSVSYLILGSQLGQWKYASRGLSPGSMVLGFLMQAPPLPLKITCPWDHL